MSKTKCYHKTSIFNNLNVSRYIDIFQYVIESVVVYVSFLDHKSFVEVLKLNKML